MPYTSQAALNSRFGTEEIDKLLERDGAPDASALTAAITDADALINGYVGAKYTLPLAYTPTLLANLSADVVRFKLYENRAPEEVRTRYEDALKVLTGIAKGEIVLPPDANGAPAPASIGFGAYSAERVFTAETLQPFVGN